MNYQIVNSIELNRPTGVLRSDGMFIPMDTRNSQYQEYLEWLEEGNEPLPAD